MIAVKSVDEAIEKFDKLLPRESSKGSRRTKRR